MQHKWTPEETARFLSEGNKRASDGVRCRGCEHCRPLCDEAYERGKREATVAVEGAKSYRRGYLAGRAYGERRGYANALADVMRAFKNAKV